MGGKHGEKHTQTGRGVAGVGDRYGRGQVWAGQGEKLGEQVGGQGWEWAGGEREWGRSKLPLTFGVPLYT